MRFEIQLITPDQVSVIINALDSSKAMGLDGLGPRILKVGRMCNNSQPCFPDQLKLAKVFPVYKSGSKSDPNSYRPVS